MPCALKPAILERLGPFLLSIASTKSVIEIMAYWDDDGAPPPLPKPKMPLVEFAQTGSFPPFYPFVLYC